MWKNLRLEQCLAFVNCQLRPPETGDHFGAARRPSITISRMPGAGGRTVATSLAGYLQSRVPVECRWTVFDRNLIEKVLEDHNLPKRMADWMPENHKAMLGDMVEELLGLHPSSWTMVHETAETILRLAQMGYVILVGRGANVITSKLENVFHVRLTGSLEKRIERVQQVYDLDRDNALDFIHKQDKARKRYLKDNYGKDIDDPLLYHMMINTDRIRYDDAARLIGDEIIHRFQLIPHAEADAA